MVTKIGESKYYKIVKIAFMNNSPTLFFASVGTLLSLIYPISVSWDGYLYIGSGLSLFTPEFLTNYHWLREPGFPFIFRILFESGGYRLFVVFQFALLIQAILKSRKIFINAIPNLNEKSSWLGSYIALFYLAGYAASVLQQITILFLTINITFLLINWERTKKEYALLTIYAVVSSLISVLLLLGIISALVIITFLNAIYRKQSRKIFAPILIFCVLGFSIEGIWYLYKNNLDTSRSFYQDNVNFWEKPKGTINLYETILKIPTTFMGINSVGIEMADNGAQPVAIENRIYGTPVFGDHDLCGRFFHGPDSYINNVKIPTKSNCGNTKIIKTLSLINKLIGTTIPFVAFIGLAFFIMICNRISLIFLIPILSQIPYLVSNYGLSRFGISQLLFSSIVFPKAAEKFWSKSRKTKIINFQSKRD